MFNSFVKVHKKYQNTILVIVGRVWKDDFSQYQAIIDENNISDCVRTVIRYISDEEIKYYSATGSCMIPYLDVYQSGLV